MVIKPKIRGFICTNAHPAGCEAHVNEQIACLPGQFTVMPTMAEATPHEIKLHPRCKRVNFNIEN